MTLLLNDDLQKIKGIGPKKAAALNECGFYKVIDLFRCYPAEYQDRTSFSKVSEVKDGDEALFKLKLEKISLFRVKKGLTIINAVFSDETDSISAKWFNKTYLTKQLKPFNSYWLYGSIKALKNSLYIANPEIEPANSANFSLKKELTPVYSSNIKLKEAKISPLGFRNLIKTIIDTVNWKASIPSFFKDTSYEAIFSALRLIHRPSSAEDVKKAKKTLAFFDQLLFQIGVLKRREALTGELSFPVSISPPIIQPDYPLPFKLTNAQQRVFSEIVYNISQDSSKPPMNRLLQGDVSSGKTLVAFLSMLETSKQIHLGSQCVFMAPTELLALQHLKSFEKFFPQFISEAAILTGSQKTAERSEALERIANGSAKFVFGTHALFQEAVTFKKLVYCIIDEQQRFGVNHRRMLFNKGDNPHQLLMSATPIPRTLSLTIFGDMDVSVIDEMPPGRIPIKTTIKSNIRHALPLIRTILEKNQQIYVVCPLIEFSDKSHRISVEEAEMIFDDLLPEANTAVLTSRQDSEETEQIMQAFTTKEIDIIIATTVIEVGIDNPNATLMVVLNADSFGLSQLHQLRGRVGRAGLESFCVFISDKDSERLNILESTSDGFELAMEDLKLRGAGDIVGTRQSGLSHPCFSHKIPLKMIELARNRAYEILTAETEEISDWFFQRMKASFGDKYKTFMEGG